MNNKGGAPKKDPHLKIDNRITVPFNEAEYNILKDKGLFNGRLLNKVIFNSVNGKSLILNTNKDPKLIAKLNQIGGDINELRLKIDSGEQISKEEKEQLFKWLKEVEQIITS